MAETETPKRGYPLYDNSYRPNLESAVNNPVTAIDDDVQALEEKLDESYATAQSSAASAMGLARIATQPDAAHGNVVNDGLNRDAAWSPIPFEDSSSYARSGMRSGSLPTRFYVLRDGMWRFEPLVIWEANTDGSQGSGLRGATVRINSSGSYSNSGGTNLTREWTAPASGRDATVLAIPAFTALLSKGDYFEVFSTSTQSGLATVRLRGGRLGTQVHAQWVGSDPRAGTA